VTYDSKSADDKVADSHLKFTSGKVFMARLVLFYNKVQPYAEKDALMWKVFHVISSKSKGLKKASLAARR
jgi:hypothetical protein